MELELIQSITHFQSKKNLYLFRNALSGEGVILAREISGLMGYRHLGHVLKKNLHYQKGVHAFILQGQDLRNFKKKYNIKNYVKSNRLLCVCERGISLLVGGYSKCQTLIEGGWLQQKVMPLLRKEFCGTYQAQVFLETFGTFLSVFLYEGRFVFLESQITMLLKTETLTSLYRNFYGYIENIHFIFSPSKQVFGESGLLLYESGVYRYLQHSPKQLVDDFQRDWEKILTKLYRLEISWKKLVLEKKDYLVDYCQEAGGYFATSEKAQKKVSVTKDEVEVLLNGFANKLQQEFSKDIRGVLARLDGFFVFYRKNSKNHFCHNQSPSLGLVQLKKIAKEIGVFCSNQKTPHTVFVKALIEYAGIFSSDGLGVVLENFFSLNPGKNVIELCNNTFEVWKL